MNNSLIKKEKNSIDRIKDWIKYKLKKIFNYNKDFKFLVPIDLGGHGKMFETEDKFGKKYLFKPAESKSGLIEPFRVDIQEAIYKLQQEINPQGAIPCSTTTIDGIYGAVQEKIETSDSFNILNWQLYGGEIPKDILDGILQEYVVDWVSGNFDSHGNHFLVDNNGNVKCCDKEQSFRYLFDENTLRPDLNYNPNAYYGEVEPIYNTIFRRFISGELENMDFNKIFEALERLNGICETIEAKDVVPMTAGALDVLRMKESSMMKAITLVKEGKANGVVSCGSTGGFLASSTISLKMIKGVKRAALVTAMPLQEKGKYVTLLDCGANIENSCEELSQFAVMGSLYSKVVCNIKNPRVYLLSNGGEDEKGTTLIKEANKVLKENTKINFIGNIEAREAILDKNVDVIVADGFSGNVFLKSIEGTAKYFSKLIKDAFKKNIFTKIGYLFSKKGIDDMKKTMDYKSVGGALLLGVNGVVVKAHGNSDAQSFESALNVLYKMIKNDVVNEIKKGIE